MTTCISCNEREARSRGWCKRCYDRLLRRGEIERRMTPDELMDEWVFLRGWVTFEDFAERVGMKLESWEKAFYRAKVSGDPRAVRARNDPHTWPDPASGLIHVLDRRKQRLGAGS